VVGGWTKPGDNKFVVDNGGYQSLLVEVDSTDAIRSVAKQIDQLGVSTATGLKELQRRKDVANAVGAVLGSLGLIALGIAALGVMNTMVMSVLERTREIGVMRAVGARRRTIRRLFTFEAATLGFLGGVIGLVLGYAILLGAKQAIKDAVDTGAVRNASFAIPLWLIGAVLVVTTTIGLTSGFIPARRAARLDPVEALRYE
jgi:putative ABC transport system permease protein